MQVIWVLRRVSPPLTATLLLERLLKEHLGTARNAGLRKGLSNNLECLDSANHLCLGVRPHGALNHATRATCRLTYVDLCLDYGVWRVQISSRFWQEVDVRSAAQGYGDAVVLLLLNTKGLFMPAIRP